jgi:hypothetical protein
LRGSIARIVEYPIASGTHANRRGLPDSTTGATTIGAGAGADTTAGVGGGGAGAGADTATGAGASDLNTHPDSGADVTSAGGSNDGFARFRGRDGGRAKRSP